GTSEDSGRRDTVIFYANVTSLTDKAWKFIAAKPTAFDHWAIVEPHIHMGSELNKLAKYAKKLNLRTAVNPVRRSQRPASISNEPKASEGGEVWFSQKHLECGVLGE
ncbi:unnamed protein product, partial [Prorocentrum cordatum]